MNKTSGIITGVVFALAVAGLILGISTGAAWAMGVSMLCLSPVWIFALGFTVRGISLDYRLVKRDEQIVSRVPRQRQQPQAPRPARPRQSEPMA